MIKTVLFINTISYRIFFYVIVKIIIFSVITTLGINLRINLCSAFGWCESRISCLANIRPYGTVSKTNLENSRSNKQFSTWLNNVAFSQAVKHLNLVSFSFRKKTKSVLHCYFITLGFGSVFRSRIKDCLSLQPSLYAREALCNRRDGRLYSVYST